MINILIIALTLFSVIAYSFMFDRFTQVDKAIKDVADNQFDAEQVMKLYAMKYAPKPLIISEKKNVVCLYASFDLPYEYRFEITEDEIYSRLVSDIAEDLRQYIDFMVDKDIVNMTTKYRARLQVIKPKE